MRVSKPLWRGRVLLSVISVATSLALFTGLTAIFQARPARGAQATAGRIIPEVFVVSSITQGIAVDAGGNIYIPLPFLHIVEKITPDGKLSVVAGTGAAGINGDGGPASKATLLYPVAVTIGPTGNLYIADVGSHRIRMVDASGTISTVLNGSPVFPAGLDGNGKPVPYGSLIAPGAVAVDPAGGLYFSDRRTVGHVTPEGVASTVLAPVRARPLTSPLLSLNASAAFHSMAVDTEGNLYGIDRPGLRLFKRSKDGNVTAVQGVGAEGGPPAQDIEHVLNAIAIDKEGNIYVAEGSPARILKVGHNGEVRIVDGAGALSSAGAAQGKPLGFPRSLATDSAGNLYIADIEHPGIRKLTPAGDVEILFPQWSLGPFPPEEMSQIARMKRGAELERAILDVVDLRRRASPPPAAARSTGSSAPGATAARTPSVSSNVTVLPDSATALTITLGRERTVALLPQGLTILRGSAQPASSPLPIGSNAARSLPAAIAFPRPTPNGVLSSLSIKYNSPSPMPSGYVAPHAVRTPLPVVSKVVGKGIRGRVEQAITIGLDGSVVDSVLVRGLDCALDEGAIQTVRGWQFEPARLNGLQQPSTASVVIEFNIAGRPAGAVPANASELREPAGIALDAAEALYVAVPAHSRIRKVAFGTVSTLAGHGSNGITGNGWPALNAELNEPGDIAIDRQTGTVYIADTGNSIIRKIVNDTITTAAGSGSRGFSNHTRAICADLNRPAGLDVDRSGNIYVADTGNSIIRKISSDATIKTIAGNGRSGFNGDGGKATDAALKAPMDVAVGISGDIYVADTGNNRIRKIQPDETIVTVAGTGAAGFSGDGGPAADARLNRPSSIAVDDKGNVYVADTGNHRIRKITADGTIQTIAGDTVMDGGGKLKSPRGVAIGTSGALYISDSGNHVVRMLDMTGALRTITGRALR